MMNILGIDSSGLVASVALQSDDKLVGEYTIHNKKTHSQTLLPMIHDMLEMADVSVKECIRQLGKQWNLLDEVV